MEQNTFERASWVASKQFGTAKVEVSAKGAIALNGNRFKPQQYDNVIDVVLPEIKAWLNSEECLPLFVGTKAYQRANRSAIRAETLAKLLAAGFSPDEAQTLMKNT
jgi:hypothetical protein